VKAHLKDFTEPGRDALLFSASADGESHMAPSTLYKVYYPAREAAGREDLRWHDLRHTGAVLAAQTGATLAELMGRLGHSTPGAAMRYQHAAADRDAEIARRLSQLVEPGPSMTECVLLPRHSRGPTLNACPSPASSPTTASWAVCRAFVAPASRSPR